MTWVSWRQQRTETLIAAAILTLLALLLVPTGIQMAGAYHHDGLSACLGQNPTESCSRAIDSFSSRFGKLGSLTDWLTLVPGLVGALLAAPFVLADSSQIHQVLMNLCTNAAHAMRNRPGTLHIGLDACQVDEHLAGTHPGLKPGPYALLTVQDAGEGMDDISTSGRAGR